MEWLTAIYQIIRVLFIALDIALIFALVYSVRKGWEFRPQLFPAEPEEEERPVLTLAKAAMGDRWEELVGKIDGTPESFKLAIIGADTMADGVLKDMRIEGGNMAERLEQLTRQDFSTIDRLWRAHKTRNRLVHEPDFRISKEQASEALADYEAFLKEAEAI